MIRDYDKKMEVVLDFYNQSQEILSMVHENIESFNSLYGYDLLTDKRIGESSDIFLSDEELQNKAKVRKKVLLTDLGKVGEFTLKYILLLKQMRDYPNQSFEEFNSKPIYGLADRGTGNTYINQYHMDSSLVSRVRESKDNHPLQPLHDYDYLFEMLGILEPNVIANIMIYLELYSKSSKVEKSCLTDLFKISGMCFPQFVHGGLIDENIEEIQKNREEFIRVIRESGDAFTRLRYLANNPDNKQYSLLDTLTLLDCLTNYARLVHEANYDDIDKDIAVAFSKDKILSIKKNLLDSRDEFNEQRVFLDELFDIDRVRDNLNLQETIGLRTSLTVDEIKVLLESDYSNEDLYAIITNNLDANKLRYFNEHGVYLVSDMIMILFKNDMDFSKVQLLDGRLLPLYVSLDKDTIDYVEQYPNVYKYVSENPEVLKSYFSTYLFSEDNVSLFRKIVAMDEVNSNPSILALLDYSQIANDKNCGNNDISDEDIINNISDNVKMFGDSPFIRKLPVMISAERNKKVCELLQINGFNDENIDSLNSLIFFIPFDYVMESVKKMEEDNFSLIENGNLNNVFFRYASDVLKENGVVRKPVRAFTNKYASQFNNNGVVK